MNVLRLGVNAVHALGVELGCTPFDAVDHVALGEQKTGEISAVLARDSGD